jgi:hypothetical protein
MGRKLRIVTVIATLVAAGAVTAVAAAAGTIHAEATLTGITFPDAYLSDACGFGVTDTLNAFTTADGQLGSNGEIVFERDRWRGTWTYTSLKSGTSVTRALAAVVETDYGSGAEEGSTGISTARGYGAGTLLGGPPGAGIYATAVQVVAFDFTGIPFTIAIGAPTRSAGNFSAETRMICGLLH